MSKKSSKFLSLLLAAIMLLGVFSTTAFAATEPIEPEEISAVNNTGIAIHAGSSVEIDPASLNYSGPSSVNGSYYVTSVRNTLMFTVSNRRLKYTATARDSDLNPVNGTFTVTILLNGSALIASSTFDIDCQGHTRTLDVSNGDYKIKITNNTSTPIVVNLTCS